MSKANRQRKTENLRQHENQMRYGELWAELLDTKAMLHAGSAQSCLPVEPVSRGIRARRD